MPYTLRKPENRPAHIYKVNGTLRFSYMKPPRSNVAA